METFLMIGKYSVEALKTISGERTQKAKELFKGLGGEIVSIYALLGERDLYIVAKFPDVKSAMKASIDLGAMTGISFTTSPALPVDEFDNLMN